MQDSESVYETAFDDVNRSEPEFRTRNERREPTVEKNNKIKPLKTAVISLSVVMLILVALVTYLIVVTSQLQGSTAKSGEATKYPESSVAKKEYELNKTIKELSSTVENITRSNSKFNAQIKWLVKESGWYWATNGNVYKHFEEERKNYSEAQLDCENHQASLITNGIRDKNVRRELWTQLQLSATKDLRSWIGLHQPNGHDGDETWVWLDGTEYDETAVPWRVGEPNNYSGEHCAEIWPEESSLALNDVRCSGNHTYLCEKKI